MQGNCSLEAAALQSMAFESSTLVTTSWDTKKLLICAVFAIMAIATSWLVTSVVAVQSDTNGTRSLGATLWGGVVTMVIIMFDGWSYRRHAEVRDEAGVHIGYSSRAAHAQ